MLHGNPNGRPVIKASANFAGDMIIDASPYSNGNDGGAGGQPGWTSTNVFARQIRNLEVDMTLLPVAELKRGIHWPASQATSLQNIKVRMVQSASSKHEGVFIENGKYRIFCPMSSLEATYGTSH